MVHSPYNAMKMENVNVRPMLLEKNVIDVLMIILVLQVALVVQVILLCTPMSTYVKLMT